MTKIYNNKTDYNYSENVKEIFIQSYSNSGSIDSPEIGKKLSSSKRVFISKDGRIDSIHVFNNDKLGLRIEFSTNGRDSCKEIMYSGTDGSIQRTTIYKYIENDQFAFTVFDAGNREAEKGIRMVKGDRIEQENYTYYESLNYKTDFKYDKNNRLTNQLRIRENIDLIYDISYKYISSDSYGNWTQRLILHKNEDNEITFNNIESCKYEYN